MIHLAQVTPLCRRVMVPHSRATVNNLSIPKLDSQVDISSASQASPTSSSTISQDMLHLKIRGCLANSAREPWIWWKPFNCHCHCQSPPQIYWSVGSDYFFRLLNLPLPEPELTQVAPSTHPVPFQYPSSVHPSSTHPPKIISSFRLSSSTADSLNCFQFHQNIQMHMTSNAILPSKIVRV